jgi:uncharacterized membrane protein YphA (DoxX/SURF4 family)
MEGFGHFDWKDFSRFDLPSIRDWKDWKLCRDSPVYTFFLVAAIFCELVGSITIILGCFTRFGTLLLLIFLIPTTLIFHAHFGDPMQKIHFMKNVSMYGGLLVLLSVGAGRFSLDHLLGCGETKK